MRNDHKLNVWPTPPGRAPGASLAPASCLDDRRKNDAIRQRIANLFPPAHRLGFVASNRQRIA